MTTERATETDRFLAWDSPTLDRAAEHGCLGENVDTGDPTVCGLCASSRPGETS